MIVGQAFGITMYSCLQAIGKVTIPDIPQSIFANAMQKCKCFFAYLITMMHVRCSCLLSPFRIMAAISDIVIMHDSGHNGSNEGEVQFIPVRKLDWALS